MQAILIGLASVRSGLVGFVLIHWFRVSSVRVSSVRVCLTPVIVALLCLVLSLTAPVAPASSGDGGNPVALRALARDAGAGDLDLAKLDVPGPDVSTVVLGRKLFFSPDLSLGKDVSCATCHHPLLGGADGLALPVGTGAADADKLGPGRIFDWRIASNTDPHATPGPNVPRNSPTVFNVALYHQTIFYDGRLRFVKALGVFRSPESSRDSGRDLLAVQARLPIASESEMRGFVQLRHAPADVVRNAIIERLRRPGNLVDWRQEFATAYADPQPSAQSITQQRMENALSDYQRSLTFLDSPWMRFLNGEDEVLSSSAMAGAKVFFSSVAQGGADCVRCHTGDHFTDEQFHILATPQLGRGRTRPAGRYGNETVADGSDFGRFEVTRKAADKHAFRTPALTNVALTAPYGHAGAFHTLESIVRHHLDPERSVEKYDFQSAAMDLAHTPDDARRSRLLTRRALADWRSTGQERRELSDEKVGHLVAFLEALTDDCAARPECLTSWLPTGTTEP
jgi:cytochrome c peroxidase